MTTTRAMSGSWVAVPTPMHGDGSVNYDGFAPLIDFHAENGTDAILLEGSAGEVAMLDPQERRAIIDRTAAYARDKLPVFYGVSCTTTKATLELTGYAEDQGAAGVILTVPMYSMPTQTAILDFLVTVATATTLPVGIYNNPTRVHRNIDPATVAALHREAPNFVVDKEAAPSAAQLVDVLEQTRHEISVMACDNPDYGLFATAVTMGDGMANITGNLHPREMAYLSRRDNAAADLEDWSRRFVDLLPLMRACYSLPNPVAVKAGLDLLGFDVGPTRLPLQPMHGAKRAALSELLAGYGLREAYALRPAVTSGA